MQPGRCGHDELQLLGPFENTSNDRNMKNVQTAKQQTNRGEGLRLPGRLTRNTQQQERGATGASPACS